MPERSKEVELFFYRMLCSLLENSNSPDRVTLIGQIMTFVNMIKNDPEYDRVVQKEVEESLFYHLKEELYSHGGYCREFRYAMQNPDCSRAEIRHYFADIDSFIKKAKPGIEFPHFDGKRKFKVISVIDKYNGIVYGHEYGGTNVTGKIDEAGKPYENKIVEGADIYNYNWEAGNTYAL